MENTIDLSGLSESELNNIQLILNKEKAKRRQQKINRLNTLSNKKNEWKEHYNHLSWKEFNSNYYLCTECFCYVDEPCICYAR